MCRDDDSGHIIQWMERTGVSQCEEMGAGVGRVRDLTSCACLDSSFGRLVSSFSVVGKSACVCEVIIDSRLSF